MRSGRTPDYAASKPESNEKKNEHANDTVLHARCENLSGSLKKTKGHTSHVQEWLNLRHENTATLIIASNHS